MTRSVSDAQLDIPYPLDPSRFGSIGSVTDTRDLIPLASPSSGFKSNDGLLPGCLVLDGQVAYSFEILRTGYQIPHVAFRFQPIRISPNQQVTFKMKEVTVQRYLPRVSFVAIQDDMLSTQRLNLETHPYATQQMCLAIATPPPIPDCLLT
jgi:hypothetical protein